MGAFIGDQFDLLYCMGIQKFLNENVPNLNPPLTVDGQIGMKCSGALKLYQAKQALPQSGTYDAATQTRVEPLIKARYVMMEDVQAAAKLLGVDVPSVLAIYYTESSGSGFFPSGQCAILFERHIFYKQLAADKSVTPARLQQYLSQYPGIVNPTPGGYSGGVTEWARFKVAQLISDHDAKMAISMGLFQIMGFNYTACGYDSVEAYFNAMVANEKLHLSAFIKFVSTYAGGTVLAALRNHDWVTVATKYNGTANVPVYSAKLKTNYQANIQLR